jgi:hypothetical protein
MSGFEDHVTVVRLFLKATKSEGEARNEATKARTPVFSGLLAIHSGHATSVGSCYAYGLAAAGEAGIERAIEILRADLDRTLRLLGCPSISALDRSYVTVPKSWE